jgi:hypothetical protein
MSEQLRKELLKKWEEIKAKILAKFRHQDDIIRTLQKDLTRLD